MIMEKFKNLALGFALLLSLLGLGMSLNNSQSLGGTTDDNWTVGGNLAVTGTSALTGASTLTGALTVEGDTNLDNFVNGGASLATSTNGAGTFTAAQVCDNNIIVATPEWQPVTLTFPTAALLIADCLPTIGDEKKLWMYNATTTTGAASIITLADGANGDHQESEGGTTLLEGTEWAELTFMNYDGTTHLMLVRITQVAD